MTVTPPSDHQAANKPRLALPSVTLCAVSSSNLRATVLAMETSLAQIEFADALLFTDRSPADLGTLEGEVGESFLRVTPGVRPAGADSGDQTRVTTPAEATVMIIASWVRPFVK